MDKSSSIFVAAHKGMVGAALVRGLDRDGLGNLLLRTPDQLDLGDAITMLRFFEAKRPDYVFVPLLGKGGVTADARRPADHSREQVTVAGNVLEAACRTGVRKVLLVGSARLYPKDTPQPAREEALLAGQSAEPGPVAVMALCQEYARRHGLRCIGAISANLYGPGDDFDLATAGVLPALISRLHEARETGAERVVLRGTGTARREFLHVDDLADACLFLMRQREDPAPVNVGTGRELTVHSLAGLVAEVVGYPGGIGFDRAQPDGAARKALDASRLQALGWQPKIDLPAGIAGTYRWFLESRALGL